jgi:hemolysin III
MHRPVGPDKDRANRDRLQRPSDNCVDRSAMQERLNVLTHGVGFVLSVVGAVALVTVVWQHGDAWRIAGCLIYAASLVGVYTASTLSHGCQTPRRKDFFRALDQGLIYLLIVATYTPFSLAYLRGWPWWILLAAMWAVALFGFFSKLFYFHRVNAVSIWLYLALGWLPIVSATALVGVVPAAALWWMLIGGICYTLGTVFLIFDQHVVHFHAVWHLWVIAGSMCHFLAILLFVARVG